MSDYEKMVQLTKELKALAMEKNIPIIGAQQHHPSSSKRQWRLKEPAELLVVDGSYLLSLPTFKSKP